MNRKLPKYDAALAVEPLRLEGVLEMIHEGRLVREIEEKLRECVSHVMKKGGKPTLSISLTFGKSDDKVLQVLGDVKHKLPAPIRSTQVLYARADGNLYEHDPEEVELELEMRASDAARESGKVTEMPPVARQA